MAHWLQKIIDLLQADTIELRKLATLAGGDPKTFFVGTRLDGVDVRGQDLRDMHLTDLEMTNLIQDKKTRLPPNNQQTLVDMAIAVELNGIHSRSRQEDRIALLLKAVLVSPENYLKILDGFQPKAKLEAAVRAFLLEAMNEYWRELRRDRQQLADLLKNQNAHDADQAVEVIIGRAVEFTSKEVFPTQRGTQLYALAQHLSDSPIARSIIRRRLAKTNSMYVENLRQSIADILNEAE